MSEVQGWMAQFVVSDEKRRLGCVDLVAFEKERREEEAMKVLRDLLRDGQAVAVKMEWEEDRDVLLRCTRYLLSLYARAIPEIEVFYMTRRPVPCYPDSFIPRPKPPLLKRFGKLIADIWEEASTGRQILPKEWITP